MGDWQDRGQRAFEPSEMQNWLNCVSREMYIF